MYPWFKLCFEIQVTGFSEVCESCFIKFYLKPFVKVYIC